MPADIIIYAIVAAGLVFWLRNILGTRSGDEPQRPNPIRSNPSENKTSAQDSSGKAGVLPGMFANAENGTAFELGSGMSVEGEAAERGLVEIARADRHFDLSQFLNGAQDAFVMIVESFAEGNKEALKNLLGEALNKSFAAVIDERKKSGQKANVEIHAIRRTEVVDACVKNRIAYITVRFIADETNLLYDSSEKLLVGDPDKVTETIDIWTFGRDTHSRSPVWSVYETRDEDAAEDDHKTVPDGKAD